jgi:hypothetical protein
MFILSRAAETYARLSFAAGPGGEVRLSTSVHWTAWPKTPGDEGGLDAHLERWRQEYAANVQPILENPLPPALTANEPLELAQDWWDVEPWHKELDAVFYEPSQEELHELLS